MNLSGSTALPVSLSAMAVSHFITLHARFGRKVIPLHATVERYSDSGNTKGFASTHS